jgi:hypothetical protein
MRLHETTSPSGRLPGVLALLLAAALAQPPAADGMDLNGFLRAPGEGDVALTWVDESYDRFWVGTTKVEEPALGEVATTTFSLWTAYGVLPRLTLFANLPYVDVEGDGFAGLSDSGWQDLSLVAAYRVATVGNSDFVAAGGVRTPLSDYEGNAPVSLGDDTTDVLLRFVHLWQHGGFYWSQQVGYDIRSDDAPDGFPLYTELGWTVGPTTLSAYYSHLIADGGTDIGDPGFTFPSNQEEYERVGGKLFGRFTETIGGSFAAFTTLDGRNTGETTGASAGLVLSF